MSLAPCPICQKPVPPRPENTSQPFCSRRCRAVDLGRWLGEEYRVPDRQAEQQEDELPSDGEPRRHHDA
ncbi:MULTISPECIES: DNA gyrase inhibitor YacG [unclassified Corallococcus]|uniref:DNA gyrase inhibitor YacG n=1 Tax=unclassified Corallococcus TaxID=2685029 RepID=UPI001A8D3882|nr:MULTISPECIES: DNA gyrase inhibitor YacG [unclassified Corallococcus]MBN9685828.1 DNA gyrase inhibitor YacG [Corallococcus sp. NCSPR001]WAS82731.1 DNA gyrase inhibitor YacG [Corallococcus sp. NCRR]